MTPRQADSIIKAGVPVTVRDNTYGDTLTARFVRRCGKVWSCRQGCRWHIQAHGYTYNGKWVDDILELDRSDFTLI